MAVSKTVHYRKFDQDAGGYASDFETLLKTALGTNAPSGLTRRQDTKSREFEVPRDNGLKRISLYITEETDYVFGTILLYSPNERIPVIYEELAEESHGMLDDAIKKYEVGEQALAAGIDYLKGISYWLIRGNHLFVVQHIAIQVHAYEEYFSELLREANLMNDDDSIVLKLCFDKNQVGGDLGALKTVEIGGVLSRPPEEAVVINPAIVTEENVTVGRKRTAFSGAESVLKAIFSPIDAENIIQNIPADAALEVDVRFGYRTRRRTDARATLEQIAVAARHLPDGQIKAVGNRGKADGDDLRLSANMPFEPVRDSSALLDLADARSKLLTVYQRFVEDGMIEP
jgi:hypothetical protein